MLLAVSFILSTAGNNYLTRFSITCSNKDVLYNKGIINSTDILDDYSNEVVQNFNITNSTEVKLWDLKICSLETMLAESAEGTGLA